MIPDTTAFFLCDFETTGVDPDIDQPIEIGGLYLDNKFNILKSYESLIVLPNNWYELNKTRYQDSFKYHGINYSDLKNGKIFSAICNDILQIHAEINTYSDITKFIILSDNTQFEYRFMQNIFKGAGMKFPFHYCGWDTSLLLELLDIGDPKDVPHRALRDSALIYRALIAAVDKLK